MIQLIERFRSHAKVAPRLKPQSIDGRVLSIKGLLIEATSPRGTIGDMCYLQTDEGRIKAEIVGFDSNKIRLMALENTIGIRPGSRVEVQSQPMQVPVGESILGRILNGYGEPIDGKGPIRNADYVPVNREAPPLLTRQRIREPLPTGVRAIDGVITIGRGQRVGLFAGSGVGKSVLLGMLARYTKADVNVIALIGERGREVREFVEGSLGAEALANSVVVVATAEQPATLRTRAAFVATRIAEYFRNAGLHVMLLMDSLTRVAMAQREIGLANGEPPTTKGYTPSVFALLPSLLERAGADESGTITGLYTVLVEGDDMDEPISDTARSILDGHIVLRRRLANKGHFPAIDVLESISRVKNDVTSSEHQHMVRQVLEQLATYREAEDLINVGAYVAGSNPAIDRAIKNRGNVLKFLQQQVNEVSEFEETINSLGALVGA